MRFAFLTAILFLTATGARADHRPALIWEGDVDGSAVLIIQGDRVDVDNRTSGRVDQNNFRFVTPLQEFAQSVEVEATRGQARVRVLEQPSRSNNYTAVVQVDARGRGVQPVALNFYWEDRRNSSSRDGYRRDDQDRGYGYGTRSRSAEQAGNGFISWSGSVDGEVFVLVRGRQVLNTAVRGRNVIDQRVDTNTPLPRRAVNVRLDNVQGRGQVELAEQPSPENNYTAKIRIIDPDPGSGSYSFALTWDSGGGYSGGGALTPSTSSYASPGSLRWAGQVDGRVRLRIHSNQAMVERLSGQPVFNEQANFSSAMPNRALDLNVNRLRGRGEVALVERPSPGNNYTAVVEINDPEGGADFYELEISWR